MTFASPRMLADVVLALGRVFLAIAEAYGAYPFVVVLVLFE